MNLESLFKNAPEKTIEAKSGVFKVKQIDFIPDGFWDKWKSDKEELKKAGYRVSKFNGTWSITKFIEKEEKAKKVKERTSIIKKNKKEFLEKVKTEKVGKMREYLLKYQYRHFKNMLYVFKKNGAVIDASDTGTGKTYVVLALCKKLNLFPIVLTRKPIRKTFENVMKDHFGIDGFVSNYESYRCGKTDYCEITEETDRRKSCDKKFIWDIPYNAVLILDECFVYDTLIQTEKGMKKIGDVVNNQSARYALSFNFDKNELEFMPIVCYIKKERTKKLYTLKTKKSEIACTESHKIWSKTHECYKKISEICCGEELFVLRKEIRNEESWKVNGKILFKRLFYKILFKIYGNKAERSGRKEESFHNLPTMQKGIQSYFIFKRKKNILFEKLPFSKSKREESSKSIFGVEGSGKGKIQEMAEDERGDCSQKKYFKKNERKESYVEKRCGYENERDEVEKWDFECLAWRKGREWKGVIISAKKNIKKIRSWMGGRTCSFFGEENERLSDELQNRYSERKEDGRHRNRWEQPSISKSKKRRHEKDELFSIERVESVEILELGSLRKYGRSDRSDFVYDIEVEDNHNYFADGILVSNCQAVSNPKTIQTKMFLDALDQGIKSILMSATLVDNPTKMYACGKSVGLFKNTSDFFRWQLEHGVFRNRWNQFIFVENRDEQKKALSKIGRELFPFHGSRMTVEEAGDAFKKNTIIPEIVEFTQAEENKIKKLYKEISSGLEKIDKDKLKRAKERAAKKGISFEMEKNKEQPIIAKIIEARQKVEMIKCSMYIDMAKSLVEEGCSPIIFVNYLKSLDFISKKLKCRTIQGSQDEDEREEIMDRFRLDKDRIVACQIAAGGVGLNLHDIVGKYPRVSIISPDWSPQKIKQVLGRIHRAGGKTDCVQKIVCAANTVEETVYKKLVVGLENYELLNDGKIKFSKKLNNAFDEFDI